MEPAAAVGTAWWIGLNDLAVEGTFRWLNDEQVWYTHWSAEQPDNYNGSEDCVEINASYGYYWNDSDCNATRAFVCEAS